MNNRERVRAVLHRQPYDRMPVVSFGYWTETLDRWADEGHIRREDAESYKTRGDNAEGDSRIMRQLGFDLNWACAVGGHYTLLPAFEETVLETRADGSIVKQDSYGHIICVKPGIVSIPSEIGTRLEDRAAWENEYLPRLQYSLDRVDDARMKRLARESAARETLLGVNAGSLYGRVRDMLGIEGLSYMAVDDPELYEEIVHTCAELCERVLERVLSYGIAFDFAHFWEDICFKNGPLVRPEVFETLVGPHYARITKLLKAHDVDIVSLDCDGCIDLLVPIWLKNGVNTMFPIEVGTWNASIAPWREKYGEALLGVGGMDKRVFARDRAAVDAEIERLKPLVALGGYIPCPDHRIAPDAQYDLVRYYCDRFRETF